MKKVLTAVVIFLSIALCVLGSYLSDRAYKKQQHSYSLLEDKMMSVIDRSVTELTVDDFKGVTAIGNYAFADCTHLTKVEIPAGITSIGDYAFSGCSALTEIVIPNTVESIGQGAFKNCSSLDNVILPDSVTSLGGSTFSYCSNLKNIVLSNNLTTIDSLAFGYCSSLEEIVLPQSLMSVGNYVFRECTSLTTVILESGIRLQSFSNNAFSVCENMAFNEYNNGYYLGNAENPYLAFWRVIDKEITSFEIHSDTEILLNSAFSGCSNLVSLLIPKNVVNLCAFSVSGISNLTTLEFEEGSQLEYVGTNAFGGKITSIVLPGTVVVIDSKAFEKCTALTEITILSSEPPVLMNIDAIPSGVTTIYVPIGKLEVYKTADVWSSFADKFVELEA